LRLFKESATGEWTFTGLSPKNLKVAAYVIILLLTVHCARVMLLVQ